MARRLELNQHSFKDSQGHSMKVEQQYLSHYWQGSLLPWTQNIQLGKYLLIWEKLYADILNSMNSECVCIWRHGLKNY